MFDATTVEAEPPQSSVPDTSDISTSEPTGIAGLMLAALPPVPQTHALVIGRHTLVPVLTLMKSGCAAVETHALSAPHNHPDPATLAWISDVTSEQELAAAIAQASACLDTDGAMVLNATKLSQPTAVAVALKCLMNVGFRLRSVIRQGQHLILVAARRPQLATVS
jgi:hypothetical protein